MKFYDVYRHSLYPYQPLNACNILLNEKISYMVIQTSHHVKIAHNCISLPTYTPFMTLCYLINVMETNIFLCPKEMFPLSTVALRVCAHISPGKGSTIHWTECIGQVKESNRCERISYNLESVYWFQVW